MIIEWFTDSHSQSLMSKPPRPDSGSNEHYRDRCGERVDLSSPETRRNVASREFVTEPSSEVGSEEAPERDADSRNTRTNYTFKFGPGSEVL